MAHFLQGPACTLGAASYRGRVQVLQDGPLLPTAPIAANGDHNNGSGSGSDSDSEDGGQLELEGRLLSGAALMMNEFVFFHPPSKTLICADSFYGGYEVAEKPSWFARIWFKLTKRGSFRSARLPIYRTSRVPSHGSVDELINCSTKLCKDWAFEQIVGAHGSSAFTAARLDNANRINESLKDWTGASTVRALFLECWTEGLAVLQTAEGAVAAPAAKKHKAEAHAHEGGCPC
jgi:hypothetical protein